MALLIETPWTLPLFLAASGAVSYVYLSAYPPDPPKPTEPPKRKDKEDDEEMSLRESDNDGDSKARKGYSTFGDEKAEEEVKEAEFTQQDRYVGIAFVLVTFVIFCVLEVLTWAVFPDSLVLRLAEVFYRVGFLIYGGGHVSVFSLFITLC